MKILKLALLAVLLPALSWGAASFSSAGRGTTAAGFLKLGVGARATAMGEGYSAIVDEASAVYWNPAAINRIGKRSVTFMHASYLNTSVFNYAAFAQSLGPTSGWGVGIQHFSAGDIEQLDDNGAQVGTFNPNDVALSLSYARQLGPISLGMTGKFIQSKIIDSAQALAMDFGVLTPAYFNDTMRLSMTVVNLGTKMKFEDKAEDLPMSVRFGSAFNVTDQWVAAADLGFPNDNAPFLAAGTEYNVPLGDALSFSGRCGYNSRSVVNSDQYAGIAFGFGLGYRKLSFDYGFLPFGSFGLVHRISLTRKF
jgi:hypothetical protein